MKLVFATLLKIIISLTTIPQGFSAQGKPAPRILNLNPTQVYSHLEKLISPFPHCLVHLINFPYLNIPETQVPLVLERYGKIRDYHGSRVPNYRKKLMHRQNDGFRWKCVFHGFLYPKTPKTWKGARDVLSFPPFYTEYWTGNFVWEPMAHLYRHQDYYVCFTGEHSLNKWIQWVIGVQGGQSFMGIYISKY